MQAAQEEGTPAIDRRDAIEVRVWRRLAGLTRREAARDLGVSERMLAYYEGGDYAIPKTVMLAIRHLSPLGNSEKSFGRERWVRAVDALLRYGSGDPVVGQLLKARRLDELADLLDLARSGPDQRTALTDPSLFRALRDASTRMHLAGVLAVPELMPARLRRRVARVAGQPDAEAGAKNAERRL